jgi:hypothetical protein
MPRNTTYAAVSRAPISKIEPFRQRMGRPLGRQDEHVQLLHHDKYPEDGHDQQSE